MAEAKPTPTPTEEGAETEGIPPLKADPDAAAAQPVRLSGFVRACYLPPSHPYLNRTRHD